MNESLARADNARRLFAQRNDQLGHLPGPILRDLARNESATREWRKAAIELMLDKGYPEVNHPDLFALLLEVKAGRDAKDEVQSVVESAIEAPLDEVNSQPSGALKASFTTANLTQDETVA